MVNVEHQVAVSALRTDSTRFKLLVAREVPVVTQVPVSQSSAPSAAATTTVSPPYLLDPQRARNLPSSLVNTTSLGRSIPNAAPQLAQAAPTAMQVRPFDQSLLSSI